MFRVEFVTEKFSAIKILILLHVEYGLKRKLPMFSLETVEFLGALLVLFRKPAVKVIMLSCAFTALSEAHGTHSSLMARVDERLAEKPEDGSLWYQRAVLQFEHEEFDSAAEDFAKAEKFAPGEYAVLWWEGRIFEQQGKIAEARAALDLYLAKVPDHWGVLASRARVLAKLGMNAESLVDFRAALKHCPKAEPDLISEVAVALAANQCVDEAVTILEAGLKRIGPIPSLQLKMLEIEEIAERFDAALILIRFQVEAI